MEKILDILMLFFGLWFCTILTGIIFGGNIIFVLFWPLMMVKDFYDTYQNERKRKAKKDKP